MNHKFNMQMRAGGFSTLKRMVIIVNKSFRENKKKEREVGRKAREWEKVREREREREREVECTSSLFIVLSVEE